MKRSRELEPDMKTSDENGYGSVYFTDNDGKENLLADLFCGFEGAVVDSIIRGERERCYTNRMQFSFYQDRSGVKFLGLICQSGRVVDLEECHLADAWFMEVLTSVRAWWLSVDLEAYNAIESRGSLQTLTLRKSHTNNDKMVVLTVSGDSKYALKKRQVKSFVEVLQGVFGADITVFMAINQVIKGRRAQLFEMHLSGKDHIVENLRLGDGPELSFKISPASFFRSDMYQGNKLYEKVLEIAEVGSEDVIYDLYCGTSILGIFASKTVGSIIGIELSPEAVLDARENIRSNGIENYTLHQGDVARELEKIMLDRDFKPPGVIFIDPPECGLMSEAIENILRVSPEKIVYISSNPKTQAEDIAILVKKGYLLKRISPIDQSTQAEDIANIALLVK